MRPRGGPRRSSSAGRRAPKRGRLGTARRRRRAAATRARARSGLPILLRRPGRSWSWERQPRLPRPRSRCRCRSQCCRCRCCRRCCSRHPLRLLLLLLRRSPSHRRRRQREKTRPPRTAPLRGSPRAAPASEGSALLLLLLLAPLRRKQFSRLGEGRAHGRGIDPQPAHEIAIADMQALPADHHRVAEGPLRRRQPQEIQSVYVNAHRALPAGSGVPTASRPGRWRGTSGGSALPQPPVDRHARAGGQEGPPVVITYADN